eukprot:TRINITY_DN31162_c0_g1_i1.p1 TRINITY_DN31162_c0_g1~~TRINITY_DN31162_c0_g1_i1.p1  ORF type:complete len:452 (+),score=128.68 TRINITY_DN31162_c0_g1_i1:105-1460(+)
MSGASGTRPAADFRAAQPAAVVRHQTPVAVMPTSEATIGCALNKLKKSSAARLDALCDLSSLKKQQPASPIAAVEALHAPLHQQQQLQHQQHRQPQQPPQQHDQPCFDFLQQTEQSAPESYRSLIVGKAPIDSWWPSSATPATKDATEQSAEHPSAPVPAALLQWQPSATVSTMPQDSRQAEALISNAGDGDGWFGRLIAPDALGLSSQLSIDHESLTTYDAMLADFDRHQFAGHSDHPDLRWTTIEPSPQSPIVGKLSWTSATPFDDTPYEHDEQFSCPDSFGPMPVPTAEPAKATAADVLSEGLVGTARDEFRCQDVGCRATGADAFVSVTSANSGAVVRLGQASASDRCATFTVIDPLTHQIVVQGAVTAKSVMEVLGYGTRIELSKLQVGVLACERTCADVGFFGCLSPKDIGYAQTTHTKIHNQHTHAWPHSVSTTGSDLAPHDFN